MHFVPSRAISLAVLLVLVLVALGGPAAPGAGADEEEAGIPDDILPLSAVRPGMRGVARTVMSATHLEEFEVEVIDIIRNYMAKQDIILVRCLGERLDHYGIAQGMSGSPVYIDGKIVGALAYTWSWAKEAIGGITPIESMLADARRPLEGRPTGGITPTPLRQPRPLARHDDDLVPIGTPVRVGGFSAEGRALLAEALAPHGLAVRAGGGLVAGAPKGWAHLDAPVVPGASLTVDLVRGDYSVSALGTLTYVDGETVHAFGHGFQDIGETLFPLSVAYVYGIIPSQNLSFKMGGAIREIGAVIQDRAPGIVGRLGLKAPMVPFEVDLTNAATGRKESFRFEITHNTTMFQRLLIITLREAIAKAEQTLGPNTKSYTLQVKLEGVEEAWSYHDSFVGFDTGFSRVLLGLVDRVMNHGTQKARFEWVKLDFSIENLDTRASIQTVVPSKDEVRPGESIELLVRLVLRRDGELFVERIPVTIPADAPAGNLAIQVLGGDNVTADTARPVDLLDIPRLYDAFHKSTELFALVPTGRVDLDLDGTLYRNLPLSAVPRLARSPSAVSPKLYPVTEKIRKKVPYIVAGGGRAVVRVVR